MISYILAFVLLAHMDKVAPEFVSPHTSLEDCVAAANDLKKNDPNVQAILKGAAAEGAALVCMKVELIGA